ncbi:sensor histidine kinase [Ornithinicoccus halotolerans]|uniref:sensor histidine kinase n=1 Tax=Ornithinicoccus halotolerans TaxID=1748220 RepID=UPI0012955E25|nr:ATP-binding protein [Ornithinicoccus halotolerans]
MTRPQEGATVLVVDDTLLNRVALVKGVEHLGHHVLQAADGAEALETLGAERVDMVLLDLLMPGVDGFEVLRQVGADPELRGTPVLVISAIEETEDIARAIELGAIDVLPKPFDPVLLRVRLRVALEQARLRRMEQEYLRQELALRQQERLATLGRLSAGLGHELNNPAGAALSAARQLREQLAEVEGLLPRLVRMPEGPAAVAAVDDLIAVSASGTDPVDPDPDPAEAIERLLEAAGVEGAWNIAPELAAYGITSTELEPRLTALGDATAPAVGWLHARIRVRRLVEHITRSTMRMSELIGALRGYSNLDRAPRLGVDVRQGLDETLTILGHKIPDGVEVVRDFAQVPPIQAFGAELNQVWTNLVDNAVDAVGKQGRVVLRARPGADGGVVVEVEDDGPGVPEDLAGEVFDAFVTTKPPGEGTGLGLNIAHQIVTTAHGGRISVESAPGRTVFRVELPPVAAPSGTADDPDPRGGTP